MTKVAEPGSLRFTPAETLVLRLVRGEISQEEYDRLSTPHAPKRSYTVGVFQHGSLTGYNRGCRCDDCRTTHADYRRQHRQRPRV